MAKIKAKSKKKKKKKREICRPPPSEQSKANKIRKYY
jgi:hypothetical protein